MKGTRVAWSSAAIVWTAVLVLQGSPMASSHPVSDFYTAFWNSADLPTIMWGFDAEFPTGNKRARVAESALEWTNVANADITLPQGLGYPTFPSTNPCNQPEDKNAIHWESLTDYGVTRKCIDTAPNPDKMFNFQLVLDSTGQTWSDSTGAPGSDKVDTRHVATHEFGHATGWTGHYVNVTRCPTAGPFSDWETMCDSVDVLASTSDTEYGKTFRRSLDVHDIDVLQAAY